MSENNPVPSAWKKIQEAWTGPQQPPAQPSAQGPAGPGMPAGWYPSPKHPGAVQWWTGHGWGPVQDPTVKVVTGSKKVNHAMHLILTVCTFGFWLPVWFIVAVAKN